jgi:MFS family permease
MDLPLDPHAARPAAATLDERSRRRVLAVLTLWFCMALIDVGIVNVALPSIQHDLGATPADLQWILSGYTLSFGAVLIASGRAGDIVGHGAMFLAGLVLFTLASLAEALAPTPLALIGMRVVAGVGAGGMSPQVYGLVQRFFHGAGRGRAFGALGVAAALSVAIAPPLGGALIALGGAHWGWRLAFLINVPIGLTGIALVWRWFPRALLRLDAGAHGATLVAALDLPGALIAAFAVLAVLLPFVQFHGGASPAVWLWLAAGAAATWGWIAWERRRAATGRPAMVDLKLFAQGSFSNGLTIQLIYFLGMTSVWVLVALYAQEAVGFSAFDAGLLSVPSAIMAALAAHWSGRRVVRWGRRLVIGGQVVALVGLVLGAGVVVANAHGVLSFWWIAAPFAIYGWGQGATISPNQTLTLQQVPAAYAGSAGALVSTTQRIGASVGIAVVTGIAFAVLARASWSAALLTGPGVIRLFVGVALVVGVFDLRNTRADSRTAP